MNLYRALALAVCVFISAFADAEDAIDMKYLANAGVLISHGETKIVFDPLFDEDFGVYERVPMDIEDALFAGTPPFDGLDAVFVSHHHGDHFSPERMVQLLKAHPDLQLFGPRQAIESMPIDVNDMAMQARLHPVTLDFGGEFTLEFDDIEVNAVRIPHAGWPTRHADIENISFRVSLDELATVLHMGDAHTDPIFFDKQAEYWAERQLHLALPPYWYFLSNDGKTILDNHIHADEVFGVHVPKDVPDSPAQYPEELRGWTLLSVPGEEKRISISGDVTEDHFP